MYRGIFLGALLALAGASAAGASEVLIINNSSPGTVTNVTVKPGKVTGFKQVHSGEKRTFQIEMPAGVCDTKLTIIYDTGQMDTSKVEVCGGLQMNIGWR